MFIHHLLWYFALCFAASWMYVLVCMRVLMIRFYFLFFASRDSMLVARLEAIQMKKGKHSVALLKNVRRRMWRKGNRNRNRNRNQYFNIKNKCVEHILLCNSWHSFLWFFLFCTKQYEKFFVQNTKHTWKMRKIIIEKKFIWLWWMNHCQKCSFRNKRQTNEFN